MRAALARAPGVRLSAAAVRAALAGSPAPLAALHDQSGQILGSERALQARVRALRGYPIVINAWASWCTACRAEFQLFASASAYFGRNVAFLGADTDDSAGDARAFLHQHPISYPSYEASTSNLQSLAMIDGLPTTIYIAPDDKVVYVHTGQYDSLGTLEADVTAVEHSG
jgi:thiol-disulfide isomerase/thioredoxin